MYDNHLAFAERVARKYSNDDRHLVAALQIRGGHVINFGVNGIKYRRDYSYFDCSLHAEVDLVRKSGFDLRRDKVCVYRFNRASNIPKESRNSRPCPLCVNLLIQAGAGKLYFKENGVVYGCRAEELPVVAADPIVLTRQYTPRFSFESTRSLNVAEHLAR